MLSIWDRYSWYQSKVVGLDRCSKYGLVV